MSTKNILAVSLVLLFSAGCLRQYVVDGEVVYSLDDAFSRAQRNCSDDIFCSSYLYNLENIWKQTENDEKELVETEMLTYLSKRIDIYGREDRTLYFLERLIQRATNKEIATTAEKKLSNLEEQIERGILKFKSEYELEFSRHFEQEYELLESEVGKFVQKSTISLKNKTAREVKKLVSDWQSFIYRLPLLREKAHSNAFEYAYIDTPSWNKSGWAWDKAVELAKTLTKKDKLFSLKNFQKVFGEPQRTQYLSMPYYGNVYCLYYACKDGTVQIQVSASDLDDDAIVIIKDLNIF